MIRSKDEICNTRVYSHIRVFLAPNTAVTIKIINTKTDELVSIGDGICVESKHIAGVYRYLIDNSQIGEIEIAYEMSNGKDTMEVNW